MTIHRLRATKIDDLRRIGTEDGAIADEIGMSVGMGRGICGLPTRPPRLAPAVIDVNEGWPDLKLRRSLKTFAS